MAVSALSETNQEAYEVNNKFTTYGVEYQTGTNGYITWFSDGKPVWTMHPSAIGERCLLFLSAQLRR